MVKITPKVYQVFFSFILILQCCYLILSCFIPYLPGWKMFAKFDRAAFEVLNENEAIISHQEILPRVVYSFSRPNILDFGSFICKNKKGNSIKIVIEKKETYVFKKPLCKASQH